MESRLKKRVLEQSKRLEGEEFVFGIKRSSNGRPFQVVSPTIEKARYCMAELRAKNKLVNMDLRIWIELLQPHIQLVLVK